eukprot:CAMPEP_0175061046 /NCGR_PEP_ID=MMETSP0052_2-20121109/13371_1 /TAXON_ID=51329 ORGANISM="Polytomella parva, Strain SAG 63-3" /NCGR_SAMPLE_ID=MMETSP0052_2 /ASSEMBLY_ACC=CAM_ASM_000194 /LENGTH=85 /DNA_ID=CAMNT_0016326865 /DNA_START=225 /DNA_END=478 /DNA_ORIENTATION=+
MRLTFDRGDYAALRNGGALHERSQQATWLPVVRDLGILAESQETLRGLCLRDSWRRFGSVRIGIASDPDPAIGEGSRAAADLVFS